ncbi:MAG TPA: hypothetical protein VGU45_05230 [Microvirga sp.]|jgi:hypothetical protein|nr:hypothetical protein [Microvirga sp.]
MTINRLYIAGMLAFGVVAGLVIAQVPAVRNSPIPVFVWPLVASFLVDLALMPRAQAGQISPITMTERAVAVVGSAIIILVILELL